MSQILQVWNPIMYVECMWFMSIFNLSFSKPRYSTPPLQHLYALIHLSYDEKTRQYVYIPYLGQTLCIDTQREEWLGARLWKLYRGWGANSRAPIKLSCTPFLAVRQYQCLQRHHDNRAGTCQIRTVLRIQSNVSTDTSGNDERWHGACNCFQIQPGYIEKPLLASGHPNGKAIQWNSRDRSKIPKMSIM